MWTWLDKVLHEPVAMTEHLQQQRTSLVWMKLFLFALCGYALFGLSSAALRGGLSLVFSPLMVPAIFLGALLLSVPALYIFSSFLGSQMQPKQTVALGLIALVVPALVLAGMAPIHWFLAVSTGSSKIMMTCNLGASVLAGLLGFFEIRKVWATLEPHRMTPPKEMPSMHTMQGIVHREMRAARFSKPPENPETLAKKFEDIREKEVVSLDESASKVAVNKPALEVNQDVQEPTPLESKPTSLEATEEPNSQAEEAISEPKPDTSNVQDRLLTVWLFCYLGILLKLLHSFGPMLGWVG